MLHELTVDNFEQSIAQGVSLIDFYAHWCTPCKILGQLMPHLADKFEGQALIGKVNSDTQTPLTQRFGVRSLPTVIVFKDGQEVERMRGLRQPQEYVDIVQKRLDSDPHL